MKTLSNFLKHGRTVIGFVLFFMSASPVVFAQNVAINTTGAAANASAILDLTNSASMALLVPPVVLTNAAVLAPVPGPGPAGLMVYNTSNSILNGLNGAGYYFWNGAGWISIGSTALSTVNGATDGTTLSGTNVILGSSYGSTLGKLTQNTEIPFNGNNLTFSNVGGAGNLGIDLAASTTAAQALEIGQTTNTIRIDGLGTGNTFNSASAATTNYLLYANANGDLYSMPSAASNGYVLTYSTTNGPTWQAATGGVTAANNGLSLSGTTVQMGGPLIQTTSVGLAGFALTFDAGTFNVNTSTGGATNIGTAGSGTVSIATGGTGPVNIGNGTNTTITEKGNYTLNGSNGAATTNIGTGTTTGAIGIGNNSVTSLTEAATTDNINAATGAANATNIGTGTTTGAVSIGNSTGGTFFPAMSIANGVYYSGAATGKLTQTAASTVAGQVLTTTTAGSAPVWGTLSQSSTIVYGTASVTATGGFQLIPGLTQNITVPTNGIVLVSTNGGVAPGFVGNNLIATVQISLVVDGATLANGGNAWPVTFTLANGAATSFYASGAWSFTQALALAPGAHTIAVYCIKNGIFTAGQTAIVSAGSGSLTQGTLTVTILHP